VNQFPRGTGWIEVISGSMFAGKTQELIRRVRLATIARQKVQVFKHGLDTRYARDYVVSHDRVRIECRPVRRAKDILLKVKPDTEVVGVDEVHFFGNDVVDVCERLADSGRRIIAAGLDQDFRGVPFEPVARLLAVAEYVTKNLAICVVCGNPANRNQRVTKGTRRIDVGHADKYEARCRRCFTP
jgi:thymidine kinase